MNILKELYIKVFTTWFSFEIINLIKRLWFENEKKTMQKGYIKEIYPPKRHHSRSIYAKVLVEIEEEKIIAHCNGWYPEIGEEVLVKNNLLLPISFKQHEPYFSCYSETRYYKESILKVFLIPSRIIFFSLTLGMVLWITNPNFVRGIFRIL